MDELFDDIFSADEVESLFAGPAEPLGTVEQVPVRAPDADRRHDPDSADLRHAARNRSIHDDRGGSGFCDFAQNDGGGVAQDDSSRSFFSGSGRVEELLGGLNPPQRAAVVHAGAPLLVVAGAGSGKTRVLTRRIAYLISARDVHPGAIMAITFTNKAANEMRERVQELVGNRARFMWVATFHSACVRILRADIDKLGLSKTFSIYDDADSKRLVASILKERNLDTKKFPARTIRGWISDKKNALVSPAEATEASQGQYPQEIYAEIYSDYQTRLRRADALDFDDLLATTVGLLRDCPEVRQRYRHRFRHVLVDEYQDTNKAQYALVQLLCSPQAGADDPPELMVVGDSDQSIYAFRGATIENILHFAEDFPGAQVIQLEQNYRSTQNILNAANAVIGHNRGRLEKNLWTDAGDGPLITGYVADTEHDEARFIADELKSLSASHASRYGQAAVFYRTNAQSRALEEVFIRLGVPYRVVGGTKFYERKEVRDAVAYLRALANPNDDVSVERILNVPKRGIGATTEQVVRSWADARGIPFGAALDQARSIPGLTTRAVGPITQFAEMMARHREMVAEGLPADEILRSILDQSGMIEALKNSTDVQDQTRLENLTELVAVATEFVSAAHEIDVTDEADEVTHDDDPLAGDDGGWLSDGTTMKGLPMESASAGQSADSSGVAVGFQGASLDGSVIEGHLLAGPEPDDSLAGFLERIALVADSDQLPDAEAGEGAVTLMTLHTAKGLEFDTVFVTGFEEGLFPHEKAQVDRKELEEERRLAYVGLTRARQRLYVTRAEVRTMWGQPRYNPSSRFLGEIPDRLMDWRRLDRVGTWQTTATAKPVSRESFTPSRTTGSAPSRTTSAPTRSTTARPKVVPQLAVGDKVLHSVFGMGTVKSVTGPTAEARAEIDFGSYGVKLLSVRHAPLEKL